jgi:hypothetical protein
LDQLYQILSNKVTLKKNPSLVRTWISFRNCCIRNNVKSYS